MVIDGKELKPIPGWVDRYWISKEGDVWSLEREEWLTPYPVGADRKYLGVKLFRKGVGYSYRLHRLVAEVWIPNPKGADDINHLDCDPKNNRADNLEWVTKKENNNYAEANKKRSEALKGRPRGVPVRCVETKETWPTIRACADDTGYSYTNLKACLKGYHDTVNGYHFVKNGE